MTVRAMSRATLARQALLAREDAAPADVVSRLAGMQAQVPKPPFLGLWTRLVAFRPADLATALADRVLVRATAMRGTLHLLGARDYLTFRASLQPMLTASMESALRTRSEGLDLDQVLPVARALLEERPMTFDELRTLLSARFPAANDRALGYAVRTHLPLVMVPTDAAWAFPTNAAFTLADRWLGEPVPDDPDPRPLVRAYLAAFGPATAKDAQTWSGLRGLGPVLDGLRSELEVLRDERGRELFDLPDAPRPSPETDAPIRFLPEFDNLVLAHDDRSRIVADEHRPRLVTKNLRVLATFLVDGFVAGTWTTSRKRGVGTLQLTPFVPLSAPVREALAAEGDGLVRLAEPEAKTVEVTFD